LRRSFVAAVCVAVLITVAGPVGAGPVEVPVSTTAGSRFGPPTVVVPAGASLRLVQLDPLARHDVVSRIVRKGKPIFGSKRTLGFGETELVVGVERLRPGSYPFTCSIHAFMSGMLVVR
jgi:plastocyanin